MTTVVESAQSDSLLAAPFAEGESPAVKPISNFQFFKNLLGGEEQVPFVLPDGLSVTVKTIPDLAEHFARCPEREFVIIHCGPHKGWLGAVWFVEEKAGEPMMSQGQAGNPLKIGVIRQAIEKMQAKEREQAEAQFSDMQAPSGGWHWRLHMPRFRHRGEAA